MSIRDTMLETLVEIYPTVVSHLTDEGKFQNEDGKFIIYSQCTGLYFSMLYTCKEDRNPYYMDDKTLEWAFKCWDYYYTLTKEDGKTQIITFDKYWYDMYEEWCTLHWLNSIVKLSPYMDAGRLKRWEERCYTACRGIIKHVRNYYESGNLQKELDKHAVQNHYLWNVVCAYRYGQLFNDMEVCNMCVEIMKAVCRAQHPAGTWLEGGSLVVGYSQVSYGALAMFNFYSDNAYMEIVKATEKCVNYLINCYYEDSNCIAALDTRQRYKAGKGSISCIPGSLLHIPLIHNYASVCVKNMQEDPGIAHVHQGLGHYVEAFDTIPQGVEMDLSPQSNYQQKDYIIPDVKACVIRKSGWTIAMCAHEQQIFNNRWIMERMNLFSIYRTGIGELVGGGQSTSTPELSCFNIIQNGKLEYLHKNGELQDDIPGMGLTYNEANCTISFEEINDNRVRVRYSIKGLLQTAKAYVHIPLYVVKDMSITAGNMDYKLDPAEYFSKSLKVHETVNLRGAKIMLDQSSILTYPVFGFNPYVPVQEPGRNEAYAVLKVACDYMHPEVVLEVSV